jgi:hypothetical protein
MTASDVEGGRGCGAKRSNPFIALERPRFEDAPAGLDPGGGYIRPSMVRFRYRIGHPAVDPRDGIKLAPESRGH